MTPPELTSLTESDDYQLIASRGVMRMLLMSALADANLWTRSTGAGQEMKNHWSRRGNLIRGLLTGMPAPVNSRDPYEDLPGEPTPEEAAAARGERVRSEDARRDTRAAVSQGAAAAPSLDDILAGLLA